MPGKYTISRVQSNATVLESQTQWSTKFRPNFPSYRTNSIWLWTSAKSLNLIHILIHAYTQIRWHLYTPILMETIDDHLNICNHILCDIRWIDFSVKIHFNIISSFSVRENKRDCEMDRKSEEQKEHFTSLFFSNVNHTKRNIQILRWKQTSKTISYRFHNKTFFYIL